MAAATKDRNTLIKERRGSILLPVKGTTKIYKGTMVMLVTGTGYAVPAADTANGVVMGVAEETVDNTGADGAKNIRVATGVFKFTGLSVVAADHGKNALVVTDQEVQDAATTNNIVAGRIREVESDGVWILIDP